jgi:hypothetical protein
MREFLTSGQVGNIEINEQRKIREKIQNRWDSLGFTEGLEGTIKENIATLYENEAKHLISEATNTDSSGSFETVVFPLIRRIFSRLLANDIVSVQAMNLPVGKLFFILPVTSEREWELPESAATPEFGEIVDGTVGRHTGLMGYDRTNRNKGGRVEPRYYLPDEVVNGLDKNSWYVPQLNETIDDATSYDDAIARATEASLTASALRQAGPDVTQYFQKSLYDLFYNDFLYDNSKGKVTIKVGTASPVLLTPSGMVDYADIIERKADFSWPLNGFDGTVRNIVLKVGGFSSFNASKLTGPDGNEMDTEGFLASLKVITTKEIEAADVEGASGVTTTSFKKYEAVPFRVATQKYGKGIVEYSSACDAEGYIYLELDLAKPVRQQGGTIDGYIGVSADSLGEVAKDAEATKELFNVAWAQYDSLELETEIGEVSFKLDSVTVSVEERKLRATWSPELAQDVSAFHNIDAEAELTSILSEQIAAEIDREILRDLRKGAPWQARWDVNGWRRMAAFSTNYTQKDWNQELMTKINQISAQIHKSTLRGGANFIVVSSEISALFDNLEYFHVSDASAESDQYNMGIEKIGSLSGRYQVYRDPYSPHWSIIIGHKGKSLLDTGYIYAPYVPMQLTPTMYNPFNFAPVKGIMTRYAKKMVNNRYYGHVRVDGLVHWNISEFR